MTQSKKKGVKSITFSHPTNMKRATVEHKGALSV